MQINLSDVQSSIIKSGRRDDGLNELRVKAYLQAMQGPVQNIITFRNDAKTVKGEKYGVLTGVCYMAPANVSGFEMCPKRTRGCSAACLFTAGQGRFPNVKQGRLRRTYQFLLRRQEFMETVASEIFKWRRIAANEGMKLAIRLNGTSDVAWENIPVASYALGIDAANIFRAFPNVQFYDYTKIADRFIGTAGIANYHLTFSRAETDANKADADKVLSLGGNVTIVFRDELPAFWNGYPVVNGDTHDIRFWDGTGASESPVVIGLLAKGDAIYDESGFVVDI